MSAKNSRKVRVLAALDGSPRGMYGRTVARLARVRPARSIYWSLSRYQRWKLIERTGQRRKFIYRLTQKGKDRLAWLTKTKRNTFEKKNRYYKSET